MKIKLLFSILVISFTFQSTAFAQWVWSPELGKFVSPKEAARDSSDEQFEYAEELYKQNELDKSIEELESLLENNPAAYKAAEAQYRLGTIYEESEDFLKALNAYKKLIESYPNSDRFEEVVERIYSLGNIFLSGQKGKFFGVEIRPSLPLAVQAFEHIVQYAPYGEYGDQAQFQLAVALKRSNQFGRAMEEFQNLIDAYPQSDLLEDARFQLAETSYEQSVYQNRDQRALDTASQQVERFLERYPDAKTMEKAAKIHQEIDEKNARKNYRVGVFYEKQNFIHSALIYYRDVADRYPHTAWGHKALEKTQTLSAPVEYVQSESERLKSEIEKAETLYEALDKSEKEKRSALKKTIKDLEARESALDKVKVSSMDRLDMDLERRKERLEEKFKKLEEKIEKHGENQTPEFQDAIERWRASLEEERDELDAESGRLGEWREDLGVERKGFTDYLFPFSSDLTPVEKVQSVEAKKLYKIAQKKRELLDEKENLYRMHHNAVGMGDASSASGDDAVNAEITQLESKLKVKKQRLMAIGTDSIEPTTMLVSSVPVSSRFDLDHLEDRNLEELLEIRSHLKSKLESQQMMVDTLGRAFNEELMHQKQQRAIEKFESGGMSKDPQVLRKEMKAVEKEIRARYEDIDDRHENKKKIIEALDAQVGRKSAGSAIVGVVKAPVSLARVFLFGRKDDAVKLSKKAEKSGEAEAMRLKNELEFESLMIQAQTREIESLERELELLRANASLVGGFKFRPSMVAVPYEFLDEAIQSSEELLSSQDRSDNLLDRLAVKTSELDQIQADLNKVESALQKKSGEIPSNANPNDFFGALFGGGDHKASSGIEPSKSAKSYEGERSGLREEIKSLESRLDDLYSQRESQGMGLAKTAGDLDIQDKKLHKKLRRLEKKLAGVVRDQMKLEEETIDVLSERVEEAEKQVEKTKSRAMKENLNVEKSRIESKIDELRTRLGILDREYSRLT